MFVCMCVCVCVCMRHTLYIVYKLYIGHCIVCVCMFTYIYNTMYTYSVAI